MKLNKPWPPYRLSRKKNRRLISSSGAYQFLLIWGFIWLFGFLSSQFVHNQIAGYIWMGLDTLGGLFSAIIGIRMGRRVRNAPGPSGKRIGAFWSLLVLFCIAAISVVWPSNAKQLAMIIILFVTMGWITMSLLLSIASIKPGLVIFALALIGYFL
ncbi:MAG: hypothetical protein V2A34_16140, partial [Lentisphaerota bacterium]